ncbi:MAG: 30S ribosomal protein S3 [Candidatus Aerophobetes bacterium]|nr:30S ribosomal protein S3 [Candidatus Aerophobetes bacterium]
MGQKVNPEGLRLGIIKKWKSEWYEEKDYARCLHEDLRIRRFLEERFKKADISRILIERAASKIQINIFAARPGIVIGKKGETIEKTKQEIEKLAGGGSKILLNVQEVGQSELDSRLVAKRIASQLEKKIGAKKVMRRAISRIIELGAEGIRITCQGRINGAEIARKEWMKEGRVPLHTIRADIDYGTATAHTTYGCIGVKVWICKGDTFSEVKGEFANESSTEENKV